MELKTIPGSRRSIKFLDRVIKATRCPHNRNSSIFETVNLIQAAGLKCRWHQKHIGAGLYLVGKRIVKADVDADSLRICVVQLLYASFVIPVARAENDQIGAGFHNAMRGLKEQVDSFLRCEARNQAKDRPFGFDRKPERIEQVGLAGGLSR